LAEELIIDWVRQNQLTGIEVASKWGYTYTANFNPHAKVHEVKEHSLSKLQEQWEVTKQLLPLLTIYQVHSATLDSGILDNAEVLDFLAQLKEAHGIRMGITTSGANQEAIIRKALEINRNQQLLFDVYQVTYNIFDQSLFAIIQELQKQNMRVVIKEALANGRIFPNQNYSHYATAYQYLHELAQKYKVGMDAVALPFCLDSMHPYKVLSGASEKNHLNENLQARLFKLDETEIVQLKACAVDPAHYWKERKQLAWN
jgi:aryl-alcohol dehydrogenase-like predicted oxidoreductase